MTIYAKFYEENSECGRLAKAFGSNYSRIRKYQSMIHPQGNEYGFVTTAFGTEEITGIYGHIAIPQYRNILEMAHTHTKAIHPSSGDLASLFARYQRGDITDIENFKFIIIAPEYVVVLQIEDTYKMNALLNNGFLELKDNKYALSNRYNERYDKLLASSSYEMGYPEGWFRSFVNFNNEIQSGIRINLYRITSKDDITSKIITIPDDIVNFVNNKKVCVN